ncbi:MAG: transmembrane 220 family protein [Bacteroidia bacterium]|nr:transmembrane 220 family protein [Bacteroidia bacterium]
MKILHFSLATMFLAFTWVQFNDPDPLLWILIYAAMTAVCVMAAFKLYYPKVMIVQSVLYLGYCTMLWSGVSQWFASDNKSMLFDDLAKMQYPYIEESREFLGLAICIAVLILNILISYRSKKNLV